MANTYFRFKQFTVQQQSSNMKVTTDGCLFGAWVAEEIRKEKTGQLRVLDIGTGTALLSLMVAQKNNVLVDAVEIEQGAAKEAEQNVNASPWKDQINVTEADIMDFQPPAKYDIVISNPPFYENELASPQRNKNLAHHSAELKLSSLLQKIVDLLQPQGSCFLLLPQKREKEAGQLIQQNGLFIAKKIFVHQTPAHNAFRVMLHCTPQHVPEPKNASIVIKEADAYTEEFTVLLKDYYLYL